ncbi:hypothetical protein TsFJ059_006228 [Trichoderma semiorbis]|uniref:Uncharacterized protein n=1 Tax=Trichoderma semiorbis TaxID=1491008 RepID=A0A9P8HCD7_9HYPO|nr:hypothetical protein TsFJ059_006228 [Trichoderma semiorbis]
MTSHGTESTLRLGTSKPQAHPPFVLELATAKQGRPWIRSLKQDMPFNQDPTGSYSYKCKEGLARWSAQIYKTSSSLASLQASRRQRSGCLQVHALLLPHIEM